MTDVGESLTVGEVVERYGVPRSLSRSTVVTMMERLRAKGYLNRQQESGVYRYAAVSGEAEVLSGIVQRFIERTLGGSLTPLTTYFSHRQRLTDEELEQLSHLLNKLEGGNDDKTGKEQS
jgi:predicted transcriptional regulator